MDDAKAARLQTFEEDKLGRALKRQKCLEKLRALTDEDRNEESAMHKWTRDFDDRMTVGLQCLLFLSDSTRLTLGPYSLFM